MARQTVSKCGNDRCNATSTPLWRKGWRDAITGQIVMLCNACGLHYKKGHFCSYCHGIYKESDADDTENPWIGCDRCSRWIHKGCEETHNEGRLHDVLVKGEERKLFLCPECRDAEQEALESGDATSLQEFHESLQYSRRKKPGLDRSKGKRRQQSTASSPRAAKTKTAVAKSPVKGKRGVRKQNKLVRNVKRPKVTTSFQNYPEASSPGGSSIVLESPTGSPLPPKTSSYPHQYHQQQQQQQHHHPYPNGGYAQQFPTGYYATHQNGVPPNWREYGANPYGPPPSPYQHPSSMFTWLEQQSAGYYPVSPSSPYHHHPTFHAQQPYYQHFTAHDRENDLQFHMARQRMVIRIDPERLSKKYRSRFVQCPSMTKLGTLWAVCDELLSAADFTS